MGVVYCITNKINNKKYIGIDKTIFFRRWKDHLRRSQNKPILLIDKKIKQYGVENFSYAVLEEINEYSELKNKEKFYIKKFETFVIWDKGYNLTYGGDNNPMSNDLVRKKHKEKVPRGNKHYMYGKKRNELSKKKTSDTMKIYRQNSINPFTTPVVKKKISEFAKTRFGNKNPNFKYTINDKELYDYYIIQNHSIKETFGYFTCSETTIIRKLKKYGISKKI